MTDRRVIPDHAERLQADPLSETGFQTMARYAREIVGDAPAVVAEAMDIAWPWLVAIGLSCAAFWWLAWPGPSSWRNRCT